ncbi:MAG: selenide, water dikinase SelD [Burkholderiales bacterium]|nr:selenide, water dikinase SelD [Bacteroidia bacterium]
MSVKLTQYSKASGCGCKIAPAVLEEILKGCKQELIFKNLLVGNETKDDAAVYELEDGNCIISTTDFFTPIVDDAFDFGKISACNAISDIYAMGGKPLMAVAILGWPVDKIPTDIAQQVIKGAQEICTKAGIPLAGGHSVDTQEPLFGLAVTGIVKKKNIKKNNSVHENDILYLTKPLGIGVLSTALKRGLLKEEEYKLLIEQTTALNSIGEQLGNLSYVNAMTDITGFGFAGHLLEMLADTKLSATVKKNALPIMDASKEYAKQFVFPDNTTRNYNDQSKHIEGMTDLDFIFYCDPQTSGGLLFSVDSSFEKEMDAFLQTREQFFAKIGTITTEQEKEIVFI